MITVLSPANRQLSAWTAADLQAAMRDAGWLDPALKRRRPAAWALASELLQHLARRQWPGVHAILPYHFRAYVEPAECELFGIPAWASSMLMRHAGQESLP